jgi:hypothetical protein
MWGWIVLLIGILYGYFTPGRQNKMDIFKKGLVIGLVLGLVFAIVGTLANVNPLGFGVGTGVVAIIVGVVFLTIAFVVGVWIGDLIEGRPKRA